MKRFTTLLLLVLLFALYRIPASAQLILPLNQPNLSGLPGQTLHFFGPLINPTPDFWEFGGINVSLPYAGFNITNNINNIAGVILDPNSQIPGNPFDVIILIGAAPGTYTGTINVHSAQIDLNTGFRGPPATTGSQFSVTVTPEGSSLALIEAGAIPIIAMLGFVRKRIRKSAR